MMNRPPKNARLLAIAPSTYGFGFAVMEQGNLVDWGVRTVTGDKNLQSLHKMKELIDHYFPQVLVVQNLAKDSRRSKRISILHDDFVAMAMDRNLKVVLLSPADLRKKFSPDGKGTKHRMAEILANHFSEELASRLPPKRRPWMSEDFRMGIFEAVGLALVAIGGVENVHTGEL